MASWSEEDIPDLGGRRALITGAASGIGYEAARALAGHGARVLLVDRNEQAGALALQRIRALCPGAQVQFLGLDLASQQAIRDFAARCLDRGEPLDLLINNAGIQPLSTRRTTGDGFELTFGIGHLGHFALTGLLLPLLLDAPSPRVVTVSSMVHGRARLDFDDLQLERHYDSQRAYNRTKLANLLFARELQRRIDLAGLTLKSIAVHPGVARTAIGRNRRQLGRFAPGDYLVSVILSFVMPFLGQPARAGAAPTLFAATAAEAEGGGFYGPDGFREMKGAPAPAVVQPAALDAVAGRRLWEVSVQLTGVDYSALALRARQRLSTA